MKFFSVIHKKPINVLVLFIVLTSIVRFFTFFPSVIDHDESTYILIAQQLLGGKIPYVHNIEVKPVGIFLIFAAGLKLFGQSVLSIRILTTLTIALTAFLLYQAKSRHRNSETGFLVGLAYIVMISLHKWTWSGNTEMYFNFFTAFALYALFSARKHAHYFGVGLLLGVGFIVKYFVLLDFMAFGLFFLIKSIKNEKPGIIVFRSLLSVIGFALPALITALIYWEIGYWDEYIFATFTIPSGYSSDRNVVNMLAFFAEIMISFLPFTILYALSVWQLLKSKKTDLGIIVLAVSWFIFVWAAILFTGKERHHYAMQAILPLVFFMFDYNHFATKFSNYIKLKYLYILFAFVAIVSMGMQFQKLIRKPDFPKLVAGYINERKQDDDNIFVMDKNIIYFLCDAEVPLKYVHTTLITSEEHVKAFRVNQQKEFETIRYIKPEFIIVDDYYKPWAEHYMGEFILENYTISNTWNSGKIVCYELN